MCVANRLGFEGRPAHKASGHPVKRRGTSLPHLTKTNSIHSSLPTSLMASSCFVLAFGVGRGVQVCYEGGGFACSHCGIHGSHGFLYRHEYIEGWTKERAQRGLLTRV
jgi:hypothetical protein